MPSLGADRAQACGGMVDRSNAEDGVRKRGAGLAVSPGQG